MKNNKIISAIVLLFIILFSIYWVNSKKTHVKYATSTIQTAKKQEDQTSIEKASGDGLVKLQITSQKQTDGFYGFVFSVIGKDGKTNMILDTVEEKVHIMLFQTIPGHQTTSNFL